MGEKRKEGYNPDTILPTDFQELLKGSSGDLCSFLYALHPVNIKKETMNIIGSAHIFAEKKQLRQKLTSVLKSWFFYPEVFLLPAQNKKDESTHNLPIEMGFIDKLGEMYRIRKILRDLKQEMEHSNGLSTGYAVTKQSASQTKFYISDLRISRVWWRPKSRS